MTTSRTTAAGTAALTSGQSRPRAALPALCLTQITSWGIVYYAFPVLNPQITAGTGWTSGSTTGAFSLALLVSAFAGIGVGRVIDHHGPRTVMTTGSVLGATSLLLVAYSPNLLVFYLGWVLAGLAMASTFYAPAFAALTRWWQPDHVRALTIVTLAGGLASTVFAPLTAALADSLGWRATYAVLAAVLAMVTVPAHFFALKAPWPQPHQVHDRVHDDASSVVRSRAFLTLTCAVTLSAFTLYAVVIALVPLLLHRGFSTGEAALALGLGGAGQTVGRTLYASIARHTSPAVRASVLIALGALTTAAFALIPGPPLLLVAVAVSAGLIRGNLTLLQATAVTDRWGSRHYGRLSGLLGAPATAASALAPFAGAALASALGGYPHLFIFLAAIAVTASLIALRTTPTPDAASEAAHR